MSRRTSKSRGTEEMCSSWRQTDKGPEVGKLETVVKKSGWEAGPGMLERRGYMARLQLGADWEQYLGPKIREAIYLQAGCDFLLDSRRPGNRRLLVKDSN